MGTAVFGNPLKILEGETKTLSTTAGYIAVKPGFHEVKMYCATQWRLALSPSLRHALIYDGSTYTEYTANVTDRVSTTHMPLDAMPATTYCYLGFSEPALGVQLDLHATNVNAEVAALDVEYCSTGADVDQAIAFTDVAGDSDGTDSPGATLSKDGVYTWTLPTSWKRSVLGTHDAPSKYSKCYWIRFKPTATLSATIDVQEIIPVYQNVNYGYMEPGMEYQFSLNVMECGGFVVLATSGTPTLDVTWVRH